MVSPWVSEEVVGSAAGVVFVRRGERSVGVNCRSDQNGWCL